MMIQIPAPDAIFGRQGITQEDKDYQGSRFSDVKAAIFANPYQKVWGDPNEPPLPNYKTTNKSVYAGTLPGGQPPQFKLASIRALDSAADLRWGEDRKGFRRLLRPNAVCVTGVWEITEDNPYSGYFKKGSQGLVIARISAGVTMTLRGIRRAYGIVLKLYPTADENHENLLQTANVFLADDLGGTTASHITEVELTNAPHVTGFNRGNEIPILLKEGVIFELVDRMSTTRQVYPIAELEKSLDVQTNSPEFMRLKVSSGHRVIDEEDVRNEVLAHIFDKGNPNPNVHSALIYPYLTQVKDQGSFFSQKVKDKPLPTGRLLARSISTMVWPHTTAISSSIFVTPPGEKIETILTPAYAKMGKKSGGFESRVPTARIDAKGLKNHVAVFFVAGVFTAKRR